MSSVVRRLVESLFVCLLCACGPADDPPPAQGAAEAAERSSALQPGVLAVVNGKAITEEDVRQKLEPKGHGSVEAGDRLAEVVESLIAKELVRQRAIELGLDQDPAFQEKRRKLQAQLDALEREELAAVFFRREIADKAVVGEADVRRYFDENATRLRTEVRVWQILQRKEAAIEKAHEALESGRPFEEVAAEALPMVPEGQAPWDLGFLSGPQVPEAWRETLDRLEPGQTSGIIRGPRGRFWILKLVDRRVNPDIRFETVQASLADRLKATRILALREAADKQLRARAHIVYGEGVRAGD